MTKRRVFTNLHTSVIFQPFIDRRFNGRLTYTELNLQTKGETSALLTGKFEPYFVNVYVLMFVNM